MEGYDAFLPTPIEYGILWQLSGWRQKLAPNTMFFGALAWALWAESFSTFPIKRKVNAASAYTAFLRMTGGTWIPPRYKIVNKLPFVPTETED